MSIDQVLWECFRHFVHLDESNVAVHCSPVRYSPITFRLAEQIDQRTPISGLTEVDAYFIDSVMSALGKYPEDVGRIEMEQA